MLDSTDRTSTIPDPTDPLGETLHLLRPTGSLYSRAALTAPWGIDLPPFDGCMMFHVVTDGECWLDVGSEPPHHLPPGSLALVPHGHGHRIRSAPHAACTPLFDIPVEKICEHYEIMHYPPADPPGNPGADPTPGTPGACTHLTCGVVRFDHVAGAQLVSLMPRVLHFGHHSGEEWQWLASTLQLIAHEARHLRPGGETMLTHLADILVIQAIRHWIDTMPASERNWLTAMRDARIGKALAAIHRHHDRDWSVDALAREAGMSRSGFAARFSELVGEPVKRYLTRWRLQLARAALLESPITIARLADRFGYQSEAAFARAFKREFGLSPGSLAQHAGRAD